MDAGLCDLKGKLKLYKIKYRKNCKLATYENISHFIITSVILLMNIRHVSIIMLMACSLYDFIIII